MNLPEFKLEYFTGIEQGTPEWFEMRRGLCTASEAKELMSAKVGFATYLIKKEAERFLNVIEDSYQSSDMFRGKELEPIARQIYAELELVEVEEVGFIRNLALHAGCSPDGIIKRGYKGLEIKCLNSTNHYGTFKNGPVADHYNQVQFAMAISGYPYWDLMYFNPDFKESHQVNIFRLERSEELANVMCGLLLSVKQTIDNNLANG